MKKHKELFSVLAAAAAAAILLFWLHTSLGSVRRARTEEGRRLLEIALRQGAAAHYADLGRYPATLDRLTGYAGSHPDPEQYTVHYDIFAENLMPDITVLVNKP